MRVLKRGPTDRGVRTTADDPPYRKGLGRLGHIDIQKFPNESPLSSKEEEECTEGAIGQFGVRNRQEKRKFVTIEGSADLICIIISEQFHIGAILTRKVVLH